MPYTPPPASHTHTGLYQFINRFTLSVNCIVGESGKIRKNKGGFWSAETRNLAFLTENRLQSSEKEEGE
jgi:hypothetical protein